MALNELGLEYLDGEDFLWTSYMDQTLLASMLAMMRVHTNKQCLTDYDSLQQLYCILCPQSCPEYVDIKNRARTFTEGSKVVPQMLQYGFSIGAGSRSTPHLKLGNDGSR